MGPQELQTKQLSEEDLRRVLQSANEPRTRAGDAAEPRERAASAAPKTSSATAPLKMPPLPRSHAQVPQRDNTRTQVPAPAAPSRSKLPEIKREWVSTAALSVLAVSVAIALLRGSSPVAVEAGGPASSEGSFPPGPQAALASGAQLPHTSKASASEARAEVLHVTASPAVKPLPEEAVQEVVPSIGVRKAVDLLLAGETRVALEAYRALSRGQPKHAEYALAVQLLERECARDGGPRCD